MVDVIAFTEATVLKTTEAAASVASNVATALLWTSVGRRMHKFNRIRQVAPMCPRGRTQCRHLANTIEPSVYGGGSAHVKLLWLIVIFGHAHLDSRTDSRALRAEYYIVGILRNTPI